MNNSICKHCGKEFIKKKNGAKVKYCSDKCYKDYRREYNKIKMREANPPKPDVTIICEWCGKSHTVPPRTAHQARFCSDDCRYTFRSRETLGHLPIEDRNAIRTNQKLKRQAKLKRERTIRTLRNSLIRVIKYKEEQDRIKELTRECEECGELFYNPHPLALTCSQKCSRRRNNRLNKIRDGKRINKDNLVDKGITLEKLYKRDKGICYLCGYECNTNDIEVTEEGHYVVGRTYPSIDHVKPLSKGGLHSWNNVKLAHHGCNTIKRDNDIKGDFKALV